MLTSLSIKITITITILLKIYTRAYKIPWFIVNITKIIIKNLLLFLFWSLMNVFLLIAVMLKILHNIMNLRCARLILFTKYTNKYVIFNNDLCLQSLSICYSFLLVNFLNFRNYNIYIFVYVRYNILYYIYSMISIQPHA